MIPRSGLRGWVGPVLLAGLLWARPGTAAPPGWDDSLYMSLAEVEPGMTGVGRSVFLGTQVEEFGVEILGVLPTSTPDGDIILARLSGMGLETSGVLAGMSGSPVYVDGRLIGAVAFAWPFASVPIGGITPIAAMLAVQGSPPAGSGGTDARPRSGNGWSPGMWEELRETRGADVLRLLTEAAPAPQGGLPRLPLPVALQGFEGASLETTTETLERMGFVPVAGGAAGTQEPEGDGPPLQPGSAVAVELVRGDAQVAGIGTVTWVQDDQVLAFGHPMLNLGPSAYPMAQAHIVTVMPRLTNSFKMGVAGPLVGTVVRDDRAAIRGTLGPTPRLVPVEVILEGGDPSGALHFEILDADVLTPTLVGLVAMNSASSRIRAMGAATQAVETTLRLRDGRSLTVTDRLAGFAPPADLAGEVARLVGLVSGNPFDRVELESVSIRVAVQDEIEAAYLEEVRVPPGPHRPGTRIGVEVTLRDYRGSTWTRRVPLDLPSGLRPGSYALSVCDGEKAAQEEAKRAPEAYRPRSLSQLLRLLEEGTPRDRLVVRLLTPEGSPVAAGRELPRLPGSIRSAVQSPLTAGGTELTNATIVAEVQDTVDRVLLGCVSLPLEIEAAP